MIDQTLCDDFPINPQRRKVLHTAAAVVVAGALPAVAFGNTSSDSLPELSGELICNISNPEKTLLLRNHSDQAVVVDHLSKSAVMFDGSIVDCNNAFLDQPVSIPANSEVALRFTKLDERAVFHRIEDFQRVQSRVKRLADGTRVIPFTATVHSNGAVFV